MWLNTWPRTIVEILLSPLFFFLQWLAGENILFTTVREGTVKAIMHGNSFHHFVMSFSGYHLNDPGKRQYYDEKKPEWEILYHGKRIENESEDEKMRDGDGSSKNELVKEKKMQERSYDDRPAWLKHLGLYWVGWPWNASVYVYQFEWNETYTDSEGKAHILPRAEATDFIFVADFTYAIKTVGAETKDRLPTDELTLVTIAIRNPYRALFSGEDWLMRVTAAINRHMRNFVGSKGYQELISPDKENWVDFSTPIIKLNEKLPDDLQKRGLKANPPFGLKGRYGVEIRTADLQSIDFSEIGREELQRAATKVYVAGQEAEAEIIAGEAKGKVIERIGNAEALALTKRLAIIREHGGAGIMLAGYDAIQESSKGPGSTIVWAGNPLGPIVEMLKPSTKGA